MAASSATNTTPGNQVVGSLSKTAFTALKCSHTWEISSFSCCWMKPGQKLDSPTFSSETDSRIKWCLSLYPAGRNDENKDNISLHLTVVSSYKTEMRVKYKFSIVNDKGEASNIHENAEGATLLQNWDEHKPSCGTDNFVSKNFLMDEANGLLPNDNLTISCELSATTIIPSAPTRYYAYSNAILQADRWDYTQVKVVELSYLWTISNFSLCKQKAGEFIKSPIFRGKNDNRYRWQLRLYPNGDDKESKGYLSIFLYNVTPLNASMQASFGFKIVRAKSEIVNHSYTTTYTWMQGGTAGRGYSEFIKRKYLLKHANVFLPDDRLTIHCAVRYVTHSVNISEVAEPIKLQSPKRRRLNNDLEVLLTNEKLSDVTLVVEGREFRAHKAILAARSPIFSAIFECKSEEGSDGKVNITDINYEVFREILWFMYTGTVKNLCGMSSALLAAADLYVLEDLKFMCEQELTSKLSFGNASDTLILADKHGARQLKTQAVDFINAHAPLVMDTEGFKNMTATYPQLISEIAVKRLLDLKKS